MTTVIDGHRFVVAECTVQSYPQEQIRIHHPFIIILETVGQVHHHVNVSLQVIILIYLERIHPHSFGFITGHTGTQSPHRGKIVTAMHPHSRRYQVAKPGLTQGVSRTALQLQATMPVELYLFTLGLRRYRMRHQQACAHEH